MAAMASSAALAQVGSAASGCRLRETEDGLRVAAVDYSVALGYCGFSPDAETPEEPTVSARLRGSRGRVGPLVRSFATENLLAYALRREQAVAAAAAWQLLVAVGGDLGVALTLVTGSPHNFTLRDDRVSAVPPTPPLWDSRAPPEVEVCHVVFDDDGKVSKTVSSKHEASRRQPEPVAKPHGCLTLIIGTLGLADRSNLACFLLLLMAECTGEVQEMVEAARVSSASVPETAWKSVRVSE